MAEEVKTQQPTEHVHGQNCNHDHDHEQNANHEHENQHQEGDQLDPKSNRGQKKFKKAMAKMGLKPVTGINRITIKKGKNFIISIDDPDVWKTPGNQNSYIIFGKPNMDGLQTGSDEVNKFKPPVTPQSGETEAKRENSSQAPNTQVTSEDLNEQGLTPDNIKMVMQYTSCSRAQAIRVLRETGDDSVNAIMKLTK